MRALWDNFRFNKPKNKYSLEHLKYVILIHWERLHFRLPITL